MLSDNGIMNCDSGCDFVSQLLRIMHACTALLGYDRVQSSQGSKQTLCAQVRAHTLWSAQPAARRI